MLPGVGIVFDGTNVVISLARGNYDDAKASLIGMVPLGSIAIKASKITKKSIKFVDEFNEITSKADNVVKSN